LVEAADAAARRTDLPAERVVVRVGELGVVDRGRPVRLRDDAAGRDPAPARHAFRRLRIEEIARTGGRVALVAGVAGRRAGRLALAAVRVAAVGRARVAVVAGHRAGRLALAARRVAALGRAGVAVVAADRAGRLALAARRVAALGRAGVAVVAR